MKKVINNQTSVELKLGPEISKKDQRAEEAQLIIQQTEAKVARTHPGSDRNLEKLHEKIQLLSGESITLFEFQELSKVFGDQIRDYSPEFHKSYYCELYRLHFGTIPSKIPYRKPILFARLTNELIYSRFAKEVLPTLQVKNPFYRPGYRQFKHFQFFTEEAIEKLRSFIAEFIEVAKDCSTIYEFKVKYCQKFGLTWQMDLFLPLPN